MDKFLERYNLPRLNQEEIENMNRPTTSNEIETVIKIFQQTKSRTRWLLRWILSNIWRRTNTYPSQSLPKYSRGRNTPKLILWGHHHPDTKTRQRYHKKENYRPISLMSIDSKILNKILANRIQQHIKRIKHHDQVGFIPGMQGFFCKCISINVIHHTKDRKSVV